MKHLIHLRVYIIILYVLILVSFDLENIELVAYIFGTILMVVSIWAYIEWFKKGASFKYDYRFRKIKKIMTWRDWWYSPVLIITYFYLTESQDLYGLIILYSIWYISYIIGHVLIRYKKPYTMIIKNNVLMVNDLAECDKRILLQAHKLGFSLRNEKLVIYFKTEGALQINAREYQVKDLEEFIELIIEKSEHDLERPYHYIKYRNTILKTQHTYGSQL